MIVVVKIVGHAGLRVGQVGKNGPLAQFEDLRFEARPQAFGLGVVVALTAAALRAQGLVLVQQLPIRVAAVLAAAVGVDEQARGGRLGPKGPLQGTGHQLCGHGGPDLPADDLLAGHVLKGAQVGPVAVGQRQIRNITDPTPVGPGGRGLVEQPVRGAAQPVGRVGRARGVGLGLQGTPAHGRAPALTAHAIPLAAQGDLQPTGAVAAFMPAKDLDQRRFPSGFTLG